MTKTSHYIISCGRSVSAALYSFSNISTLVALTVMPFLNTLVAGAQNLQRNATAFGQKGSRQMVSGSNSLIQGFSLPGEAEKAADILKSFLGE